MIRFGQDWYSADWLAQELTWAAALLVVALVVVFAGLHLARRGTGLPPRAAGAAPAADAARFERYGLGARLYHWGNFLLVVVLAVSGAALFAPGLLPPPGVRWLLVHEIAAGLFIAGLVAHIVMSFVRADVRTMALRRRDFAEARASAAYYWRGERRVQPALGKYDVWQKLYHALLAVVALALVVTGTSLFLSAEAFVTFSHGFLRWQRLIHDASAIAFLAAIIGHVYARLLWANGPQLRAMFVGWIARDAFARQRDWLRWQPPDARAPHEQRVAEHRREAKELPHG